MRKRASINWVLVIGIIGVVCSILLSFAILWYLDVIQIPAIDNLQAQTFIQADAISGLARSPSSTSPSNTK